MTLLYWLDQIQPHDRSAVGNKAWHLACCRRAGFPVLPGFVVSAEAFRRFLSQVDWLEPLFVDLPDSSLYLDTQNARQLMAIAQQIRQTITTCKLDAALVEKLGQAIATQPSPAWILRASLSLDPRLCRHSERDTVTTYTSGALFEAQVCLGLEQDLVWGLKQLWTQLFGGRSLFYWQRAKIPLQAVRLGVLVQPLCEAIAAGTAYLTNHQITVASTLGLGFALNRGEVQPALHQFDLQTGSLMETQPGNSAVVYRLDVQQATRLNAEYLMPTATIALAESQLVGLAQQIQQLGERFGRSLEVDWLLPTNAAALPQIQITRLVLNLSAAQLAAAIPKVDGSCQLASIALPTAEQPLLGLPASPGRAIAAVTLLTATTNLATIAAGTVVVAETMPVDWLPIIQQAAAIVTERGSLTSHSAIIARELGIPAVMGVAGAMKLLRSVRRVVVDGDRGSVYPASLETVTSLPSAKSPATISLPQTLLKTQLMVNLSQPESLSRLLDSQVDGVGLLRSELMALPLLAGQHPDRWVQNRAAELCDRLSQQIQLFAAALAPRPVFYRCMDLRSHEFHHLLGSPPIEVNPMLGNRGMLRYLPNPKLLQIQLAALAQVQQAGHQNLRLLLPFVRSVEEFQFCQTLAEQTGLRANPDFQIWIMAEVPSVIFLLSEFVQAGVQGISIGTNDLTQLILGIDREQADIAAAYDERHPAVQQAIAQLVQTATALGIPAAICGQAPARYPELVENLVRWGIQAISVEPDAVEPTRRAIAQAEANLTNPKLTHSP